MSISAQIKARVRELMDVSLFEIPPSFEGEGFVRELVVSEEVLEAVIASVAAIPYRRETCKFASLFGFLCKQ
jgi:hypothetical protein